MPDLYRRPKKLEFKRYPLDIGDVERLRAAVKYDAEDYIVNGLLESGMRVTAWLMLKPENVYFDRGIIVWRDKGKLKQTPLTDTLWRLLTDKFKRPDKYPGHRNRADEILQKVARRAKVTRPVTPHILRHTYAVQELMKGVDIRTLQLRMGHSSLDTTALYLHYIPGGKEGLVDATLPD